MRYHRFNEEMNIIRTKYVRLIKQLKRFILHTRRDMIINIQREVGGDAGNSVLSLAQAFN